jgi:hypothetical protein
MVAQIVNNYQLILNNIDNIIEASCYRNDYIAKKIGLQPSNFSAKKNRGNWTVEEVSKLLKVIENEDVEDYYDMLIMQEKLKEGNPISAEEFEKRMSW